MKQKRVKKIKKISGHIVYGIYFCSIELILCTEGRDMRCSSDKTDSNPEFDMDIRD